jgi:phosphoribosylanthranilate isomerase
MTWVKICGITNLEDAKTAVEAGADALGFVFYEKSPRNVTPEKAHEIVRDLPASIKKVGVFVGGFSRDILQLIHTLGLTGSQMHFGLPVAATNSTTAFGTGCFPPGFQMYLSLPAEVLIRSEDSMENVLAELSKAAVLFRRRDATDESPKFFETIFIDSGNLKQPGGTGVAFDWQRAVVPVERLKQVARVVIAGGLSPANVGEMMQTLHPWGVDVSSGVEAQPGKKDPIKVRAFVEAVRRSERVA